MFEMVTGRQRARGLVLSGLNATVPAELEQVIGRMLAANVEHRAQSAATIAAELRSIAAILDARTEAAEAAEAAEPPRRHRERRSGGVIAMDRRPARGCGGDRRVVDRPPMIIETRAVAPFQKNGYVVACEKTREAVLIDPGDEVEQLLRFVTEQSLHVRSILLTHAMWIM
jgi:hypothetical protein